MAVSVLLHVAAIGLLTVMPKGGGVPVPPPQGAVELLMVEQKGATANQGGPPPTPPIPPRPKVTPGEQRKPEQAAPPPPAPAPMVDKGDEPVPAPVPPSKEPRKDQQPAPHPSAAQRAEKAEKAEKTEPVKPAPPVSQKAPVFDLSGTDSESNAQVISGNVLPASPDNRFRNRPPPYPEDAAQRGEHGSVTVLIHVGANGAAAGVDVMQSSGYASLDRAAVAAVRAWHFHPALKDSEPVPFDMPFRFDFRAN